MKRVIGCAGVVFVVMTSTAVAAPGDTVLVSGAGKAAFGALNPTVSADGRYVAFETDAKLTPHRGYSVGDVYVKDRRTGKLVLVNRANGKNGHFADDDASGDAAISPDGNFVAFDGSRDLDPQAPEDTTPIYLRDVKRGRLVLASRASGAHGNVQNDASYEPDVSRDGRFVAYYSEASNLDPADRGHRADVYVRDVRHARTLLASRASGARGAHGNDLSEDVSISDDGRYVAFVSKASNLDPDDSDHRRDVYVRDLVSNRTILVSRATSGEKADGDSIEPSISADGRFVAFVFRRGNNLDPFDTDRKSDVYVRDLQAGTTTLVSRAAEKANGTADAPSISGDGTRVSFESTATNLDPADTEPDYDVYLRDLDAGTTTLVSPAGGDTPSNQRASSGGSSLTADGHFVVFESNHDFMPSDDDSDDDIFVRELGR